MCSYVGWLSSRSPVYEVPVYEVLKMPALDSLHCVESVQIRSFFRSVFSRIRTEYGEILRISPYSVQMRENADQNNSEYGHFLRNVLQIRIKKIF